MLEWPGIRIIVLCRVFLEPRQLRTLLALSPAVVWVLCVITFLTYLLAPPLSPTPQHSARSFAYCCCSCFACLLIDDSDEKRFFEDRGGPATFVKITQTTLV